MATPCRSATSAERAPLPGHTPGHVVFHAPQIDRVFVGDVAVCSKGSIGRDGFPLGNHQQLIDSITQRLWPAGATIDVGVHPGLGPESTLGRERQSNPYVGGTRNFGCFDLQRLSIKRWHAVPLVSNRVLWDAVAISRCAGPPGQSPCTRARSPAAP